MIPTARTLFSLFHIKTRSLPHSSPPPPPLLCSLVYPHTHAHKHTRTHTHTHAHTRTHTHTHAHTHVFARRPLLGAIAAVMAARASACKQTTACSLCACATTTPWAQPATRACRSLTTGRLPAEQSVLPTNASAANATATQARAHTAVRTALASVITARTTRCDYKSKHQSKGSK